MISLGLLPPTGLLWYGMIDRGDNSGGSCSRDISMHMQRFVAEQERVKEAGSALAWRLTRLSAAGGSSLVDDLVWRLMRLSLTS